MNRVILGLGTNWGDAIAQRAMLRRTVRALESPALQIRKLSPFYQSDALVPRGAPESWNRPFLNIALLVQTSDTPQALLDRVKELETKLGRKARGRWAPREIDIDLLAYEGVELETSLLTLPHAGLLERPFALLPFRDVAPEWRLREHSAADWAKRLGFESPNGAPLSTTIAPEPWSEWVGVLNITPDSFSDGNLHLEVEAAQAQAIHLLDQGATILDLGAESTRPGAHPLMPDEEWARLRPVLESVLELRQGAHPRAFRVSLDSRHPETVKRALGLGIDWLNDVSGLSAPRMREVAAHAPETSVVVMHSLSVPADRARNLPEDAQVLDELLAWGEAKIRELTAAGIARDRIILDPGLGFGKTPAQSFALLRDIYRLREWGTRIFVGHSRKGFMAPASVPFGERDLETAWISEWLAGRGVDYIRLHDIEASRRLCALGRHVRPALEWRSEGP